MWVTRDKRSKYPTIWLNKPEKLGNYWENELIEVEIIEKLYNHSDVCVGCHNDNCDKCKYKFKD